MSFSTLHLSDEDSARIDALADERHVTPEPARTPAPWVALRACCCYQATAWRPA